MDVLSRIKHTVSNLSSVVLGNPVTREYEVHDHVGSAGPGLLWKVYNGIKRSTKQEAAVFVLEKKQLERYAKRDRDAILDILKKGVAQLTRLRHPSLLTVQHPMEESRESLAFATEPVFASLANILGQHENMPVPPPPILKDFELYDLEIKYGLLQVAEGLAFLHHDVKMLHRNICPESVVINKSGAWKIAGFDFSIGNIGADGQPPSFPFHELEPDLPPAAQPNLDFVAPEYVLTMTSDISSDMFSLGCLVYSVFNHGKPLFNNCSSLSSVKRNAQELRNMPASTWNCIPTEAREHVRMLLSCTPEVRPDAHQFSKLQFFEDVGVKTLQYLDCLFQWDNLQKSQFYKGLPNILVKMPKRITLYRVLPCLVKEYVNPDMVPFVLPNVLLIAEEANKKEFCTSILPHLVPIFKLQEPIQILLIFMQKMELLLTKCPPDDIRNHVLPMVYRSLESDAQQIQELCLSIIPSFASLIEYPAMKNSLLPRIKKLCLNTNYLSVRVNCLVCLGKLLEHLDKWLVLDEVLPILPQVQSKEPAVLMGILGIYKLTMAHKKLGITKDIMACKVIPFLMPLTIENGLTLNQFNAIMSVVKEMVGKVETEHRAKLEQLNSIRQEQKDTIEMTKVQPVGPEIFPNLKNDNQEQISEINSMFSGLGLDVYLVGNRKTSNTDNSMPNSMSRVIPGAKGSLTIEEKEKLAREQEQQQRFKAQMPLKPTATAPQPSSIPASPRDLTSTLISSNLVSLSSGTLYQSLPNAKPLPSIQSPSVYGFQSGTLPSPKSPSSQNFSSLDSLLPGIGISRHRPLLNQIPAQTFQSQQPFQSLPSQPFQSLPTFQALPAQGAMTNTALPLSGSGVHLPLSPPGTRVPHSFSQPAASATNSAKSELEDFLG